MTAMATEKMGIMELSDVFTLAVMATEKIEFLSPFRCRCRSSVNEPLHRPSLQRCKVIRVNYTYNHKDVRPVYNKQR